MSDRCPICNNILFYDDFKEKYCVITKKDAKEVTGEFNEYFERTSGTIKSYFIDELKVQVIQNYSLNRCTIYTNEIMKGIFVPLFNLDFTNKAQLFNKIKTILTFM